MNKKWAKGLTAFAMGIYAASSQATLVTYNDFSNTSGLTMVGSAGTAVTSDGTVMRLTPAASSQTGAVYSTSPITLGSNDTFSTTFQFRFTSPGGIDPADGITFLLAANTTGIGGPGVGMGYQGVPNSVAIEFDTYNNAGYGLGNNDGNSSNHVSIDTNGVLTNTALSNVYGHQTCDFSSGYLTPGCMSNGDLWKVTIGYNGTNLNVILNDPAVGTSFTAISSYPINIASYLGTNTAYVGFTAGTGAGWENHDIVNWQFANTTELASSGVPEPASLALVGLGFAAIGRIRRQKARRKLA